MRNLVNILMITFFAYLIYIAIFTDRASVCESLINLDSSSYNTNQLITYRDSNNVDYVMIRLDDIKNNDGEPDRELMSLLYSKIANTVPNYETLSDQNTEITVRALRTGNTQIVRYPLLAIKLADAQKLTHGNIVSGAVRQVRDKVIIIPHSSVIRDNNVYGYKIDRVIAFDTLLFMDFVTKNPSPVNTLGKLYLREIHNHDGVIINIMTNSNIGNKEINLL